MMSCKVTRIDIHATHKCVKKEVYFEDALLKGHHNYSNFYYRRDAKLCIPTIWSIYLKIAAITRAKLNIHS